VIVTFLTKETAAVVDGFPTNAWQASTYYEPDDPTTASHRLA